MKHPLLSVIIVTYNSDAYLFRCLQSVFRADPGNIEIIIVDNNSQDRTQHIIKSFSDTVVPIYLDANVGFAEANNIGIKKSKGSYIFFLNPDTRVDVHIFNSLLKAFINNPHTAAAQPAVYLMDTPSILNLTGKVTHYLGFDWIRDYRTRISRPEGDIISLSGCGVMVKKSALTKVRAFDRTYFMYYEDSDLSWRLRLFGYVLTFVPDAVMYHDYKYVPVERYLPLKVKLFYSERNRLITLIKNYSTRTIIVLFPAIIFLELSMLLYAFFNGWIGEKLRGYCSIVELRKTILKNRQFIQERRLLSDREVSQHFASILNNELYNTKAVKLVINPVASCYWSVIKKIL